MQRVKWFVLLISAKLSFYIICRPIPELPCLRMNYPIEYLCAFFVLLTAQRYVVGVLRTGDNHALVACLTICNTGMKPKLVWPIVPTRDNCFSFHHPKLLLPPFRALKSESPFHVCHTHDLSVHRDTFIVLHFYCVNSFYHHYVALAFLQLLPSNELITARTIPYVSAPVHNI